MPSVLLVEPPSGMLKLHKLKTRRFHFGAPLPFIYMAPYLQRAGFEVEIIDLRISSLQDLKRFLAEKQPVVAGLSVMPGCALPRTLQVSQMIKELSPSTSVVWGGAFPSLHQEFCLDLPNVDFVVVGDGEETLPELATALTQRNTVEAASRVPGLAYRDGESILRSEPREPVDLDANPIGGWELVERYMEFYLGPQKYLAINTARGCPYRCTFCYNNLLYHGHKRYRLKSVAAAMQEIDYLMERYKLRKVQFMDDEFLGHRRRGFELVEQMRSRHPELKYHIAARVQDLKEEAVVERLAESGCTSVFIGAESASPEQLAKIQKGMTTTELLEAARLCGKHNLAATYSFACGFPEETNADLKATVAMARMLKEIDPRCQSVLEIISPVAGTPLYTELADRGQLPDQNTARWCHVTDWKSARDKGWITRPGFYEALQLAFHLAFTSAGHAASLRSPTRIVSGWASRRLHGSLPSLLPEFRLANYLIKRTLWGVRPLRWRSVARPVKRRDLPHTDLLSASSGTPS